MALIAHANPWAIGGIFPDLLEFFMYAIFTQGRGGMRWCAVAKTAGEAAAQIAAGDFDGDDVDFIFALPGVVGFRDLDGTRDHVVPDDGAEKLIALLTD